MLPNLLVAGVQRGGSTWLHRSLALQPEIFMSERKEINFFVAPNGDLAEYERYFENAGAARYRGESTPGYFSAAGASTVAERIRAVLGPDVKLIVSFRHPVQRAISAYLHHWRKGRLKGDEKLSDAAERHGIERFGHYKEDTRGWLSVFPRENFIFTTLDEIDCNPDDCLRNICRALGFEWSGVRGMNKAQNAGNALKVVNGTMTIDLDHAANHMLKARRMPAMREDFVLPTIAEGCIRALEAKFVADIAYVEEELLCRGLGWQGEKPLTFYT
jgi:hypothetical protein